MQSKRIIKKIVTLLILFFAFLYICFKLHYLLMENSLKYFTLNKRDSLDNALSYKDIRDIYMLSKTKGFKIRFSYSNQSRFVVKPYLCNQKEDAKEEDIILFKPNTKSVLCQNGDYLLETGIITNPNIPLGAEYTGHFYLIRKVDNQWIILEDLGESGWIS